MPNISFVSNASGGASSSGGGSNIASIPDAWDRLQAEFDNAPEVGYVWTINIDSKASISALALTTTEYHLKLSCSHVGETMYGVWGGEMEFDTKTGMAGLKVLIAAMGSATSSDLDVWFKNNRFLMKLRPYKLEDETEFVEDFVKPLCQPPEGATDAQKQGYAAGNAMVSAIQQAAIHGTNMGRTLINTTPPEGFYSGYYTNMTEGDLSQYIRITGFLGAAFGSAHAETDKEGKTVTAGAKYVVPFVKNTFTETSRNELDAPFPYTINVFSDGSVLFRLYNSNGGPFTANFFGTMDKIPVGQTSKV